MNCNHNILNGHNKFIKKDYRAQYGWKVYYILWSHAVDRPGYRHILTKTHLTSVAKYIVYSGSWFVGR